MKTKVNFINCCLFLTKNIRVYSNKGAQQLYIFQIDTESFFLFWLAFIEPKLYFIYCLSGIIKCIYALYACLIAEVQSTNAFTIA